MTKYEQARLKEKQAEAEALAEFMEEFMEDPPYVQDENGRWMTKAEVIERTRNSWKEEN